MVRDWPGVPRYAHLIDQTQMGPEEVGGELHGRIAQLVMMAAYGASWPVLRRLVPLLAEMAQVAGVEDVRQIECTCSHDAGTGALETDSWTR